MKIKCGDMYMVTLDHPSQLYAWSVSRVWWMPWRYNLHLLRLYSTDEVHRNLTLDGVKGTLKLIELWKEN